MEEVTLNLESKEQPDFILPSVTPGAAVSLFHGFWRLQSCSKSNARDKQALLAGYPNVRRDHSCKYFCTVNAKFPIDGC